MVMIFFGGGPIRRAVPVLYLHRYCRGSMSFSSTTAAPALERWTNAIENFPYEQLVILGRVHNKNDPIACDSHLGEMRLQIAVAEHVAAGAWNPHQHPHTVRWIRKKMRGSVENAFLAAHVGPIFPKLQNVHVGTMHDEAIGMAIKSTVRIILRMQQHPLAVTGLAEFLVRQWDVLKSRYCAKYLKHCGGQISCGRTPGREDDYDDEEEDYDIIMDKDHRYKGKDPHAYTAVARLDGIRMEASGLNELLARELAAYKLLEAHPEHNYETWSHSKSNDKFRRKSLIRDVESLLQEEPR